MTRTEATANYKKALAAWNLASCGNDEAAFEIIDADLTAARRELVNQEIANPTKKETKKENEILRLRNRGWDV